MMAKKTGPFGPVLFISEITISPDRYAKMCIRDRLRSANGGMLFLDEIGELGADEQAMLLKAIEEKTFYPFGSDRQVSSDFQLIAGTVRDLRQLVAEGKFREDLYARINLWTFTLPGLRQRQEDIEPNLDYEVERHASLTGDSVRFNTEARRAWLAFATSPQATWRGNFRELSASVTRMATLSLIHICNLGAG